jgi:aryl-alcohol dehydrogenase
MDGRFPFDRLVTFYPFAELERAFHDSEAGRAVKPVLRVQALDGAPAAPGALRQ